MQTKLLAMMSHWPQGEANQLPTASKPNRNRDTQRNSKVGIPISIESKPAPATYQAAIISGKNRITDKIEPMSLATAVALSSNAFGKALLSFIL